MGEQKTLIIAGGGTGGHVLAGVAIAEAWKITLGPASSRVLFIGSRGGLEEKLVPRAGFSLELLMIGPLNNVRLMRKLRTLAELPCAFCKSLWILLRERPQAVVGVGGYSSGPLVLLARQIGWLWGARVTILEQNAFPGFTNRILGYFAHQVFSAFPGLEACFTRGKVQVTGNPIRQNFRPLPSAKREPFTILIFGGSQGALGINSLVLDALPLLDDLKDRLRFIHQTGEKDFARVKEGHQKARTNSRVEKFIYEMGEAYAEASLLICRAGSSTLAEVAAVGRASILIPFPQATNQHQLKNAEIYQASGAALILNQSQARGEDLARLIRQFLGDPSQLQAMEKAVGKFYRPTAAQEIVHALTQTR